MAAKERQQVFNEIKTHIDKQGGAYPGWYCGITSNLDSRLHGDHKVPQENHWFITRQCFNETDARVVESALKRLGCDGGEGGGNQATVYVYAYLKTAGTDP